MTDMKELAGKISDSELEVMELLWSSGQALSITDIRLALQERTNWEATTIKTLVSRLVTKGAISQERHKVFYYSPRISREEYRSAMTGELIDKLYRGSSRSLVASLVRSKSLSQSDMDELRELFNSGYEEGDS